MGWAQLELEGRINVPGHPSPSMIDKPPAEQFVKGTSECSVFYDAVYADDHAAVLHRLVSMGLPGSDSTSPYWVSGRGFRRSTARFTSSGRRAGAR